MLHARFLLHPDDQTKTLFEYITLLYKVLLYVVLPYRVFYLIGFYLIGFYLIGFYLIGFYLLSRLRPRNQSFQFRNVKKFMNQSRIVSMQEFSNNVSNKQK
jgi:hypothetical protein